jgi:hypothetical protein
VLVGEQPLVERLDGERLALGASARFCLIEAIEPNDVAHGIVLAPAEQRFNAA